MRSGEDMLLAILVNMSRTKHFDFECKFWIMQGTMFTAVVVRTKIEHNFVHDCCVYFE